MHILRVAGFELFPAVFSATECEDLLRAIGGSSLERTRAGIRHALSNASVSAFARDGRLLAIAEEALGGPAMPYRATLFEKSSQANWLVVWHQDTALPFKRRFEAPGWGPWSVKAGVPYAHAPAEALEGVVALRVHLDPSGLRNGPLRVIPGSHSRGVLSDAAISVLVREIQPFACVVPRGGVLAMRPLLVHSSSKAAGSRPRRVLHVEYTANMVLGPGREIAAA